MHHAIVASTPDAAVVFPARLPIPASLTNSARKWLVATRILNNNRAPLHRTYVHLNYITVPLISVLVLLATGAIDGAVIRDGIVGANGVQPLDIMALFISLVSLKCVWHTTCSLHKERCRPTSVSRSTPPGCCGSSPSWSSTRVVIRDVGYSPTCTHFSWSAGLW